MTKTLEKKLKFVYAYDTDTRIHTYNVTSMPMQCTYPGLVVDVGAFLNEQLRDVCVTVVRRYV